MNKKLIIGIVAAVAIIGGVIGIIALNSKKDGGESDGGSSYTKEVEAYMLKSATSDNKVKIELAKELGFEMQSNVDGSLILENEKNGAKITFYYEHKNDIIMGERNYSSKVYYDYREFETAGRKSSEIKYNSKGEGEPFRIEYCTVFGQDETDKRYDGVCIRFEKPSIAADEPADIQALYDNEDVKHMLETLKFEKAE